MPCTCRSRSVGGARGGEGRSLTCPALPFPLGGRCVGRWGPPTGLQPAYGRQGLCRCPRSYVLADPTARGLHEPIGIGWYRSSRGGRDLRHDQAREQDRGGRCSPPATVAVAAIATAAGPMTAAAIVSAPLHAVPGGARGLRPTVAVQTYLSLMAAMLREKIGGFGTFVRFGEQRVAGSGEGGRTRSRNGRWSRSRGGD